MLKSRRPCGLGIAAFAAVVLVLVNPASASEWLEVGPAGTAAVIKAPAVAPALAVSRSDLTGLSLTVQTAGVELLRHENTAGRFLELTWPDASIHGQVGAPALPVIRRLFIAPAGASVSCKCDAGAAVRIDLAAAGLPSWIQPVQASIEKLPGALERAVFAFDSDAYAVDVDVPSERVVSKSWASSAASGCACWKSGPCPTTPLPGR